MLLEDKNAVIYGGGGSIGGVARAFAHEGARVLLAGRTIEKLEAVANDTKADSRRSKRERPLTQKGAPLWLS